MAIFILQNQHGQFLSKDNEWVSGSDANTLFRSPHHDVALNHLIEINAKDYSLRAAVVACELDGKGRPVFPSAAGDEAETIVAENAAAESDISATASTDQPATTTIDQDTDSNDSVTLQSAATHV